MKRLDFEENDTFGIKMKDARAINTGDSLLAFFVSELQGKYLDETILNLESILNVEKSFGEIMDGYADWTFWNSEGEFTCDKDKAYFEGIGESKYSNMEMPLKELIEILYEWKAFLDK